jgi:hypothetical protein
MAEKTILEKAGVAVGFGIAAATDVADAVKTAIGGAVTAAEEVLKKARAKRAVKKAATKKPVGMVLPGYSYSGFAVS